MPYDRPLKQKRYLAPAQTDPVLPAREGIWRIAQSEGLTIKEAKTGVSLNVKGVTAKFVAPYRQYGTDLNDWSTVLLGHISI